MSQVTKFGAVATQHPSVMITRLQSDPHTIICDIVWCLLSLCSIIALFICETHFLLPVLIFNSSSLINGCNLQLSCNIVTSLPLSWKQTAPPSVWIGTCSRFQHLRQNWVWWRDVYRTHTDGVCERTRDDEDETLACRPQVTASWWRWRHSSVDRLLTHSLCPPPPTLPKAKLHFQHLPPCFSEINTFLMCSSVRL